LPASPLFSGLLCAVENLRRLRGETWRAHSCVPRRDSLENPPREARKLLKIRSEYFHPPLRDAAHAHSSRRLRLDGSIGQQAPKEVSARHARVRAPRLGRPTSAADFHHDRWGTGLAALQPGAIVFPRSREDVISM